MRIKKGFEMRQVCGEYVIVAFGEENIDFSKVINLNESAAIMWKAAEASSDFSAQTLADALVAEYEVEPDTALADAETMLQKWIEVGLVEA